MSKLKVAVYWAAGCGGCDIALLELHEKILDLLAAADIVFWPAILDTKYGDVAKMPDGSIDLCLLNGAIRNEENQRIATMLRRKSKAMVAFGSCAMMGGVPGLGNLYTREDIFERAYKTSESTENPDALVPQLLTYAEDGKVIGLPKMLPKVKPLHAVVPVDYFMPGCAPAEPQVLAVAAAIASGALPASPAVVGAGSKSVCDECSLEKTGAKVSAFRRHHEMEPDGKTCLLEQGVICTGPATRSGCEGRCPAAGIPCRGCYGPAGASIDQAARMIAALGSVVDSESQQDIGAIVDEILDPAGSFYRFSLPISVLKRSRDVQPAQTAGGEKESEPAKEPSQ